MLSKQDWLQKAYSLGFSGCAFVSARPFFDETIRQSRGAEEPLESDPGVILPGATCIWVLFSAYAPLEQTEQLRYSRYYTSSNMGYFACRTLERELIGEGYRAVANPNLPHRAAARRAGGIMGDNGLYYHPSLGSRVSLHLIVTDAFAPDEDVAWSACKHCGACKRACPYGALQAGDMCKCVRNLLDLPEMPQEARERFASLLGCEVCQQVCPMNGMPAVPAPAEERGALDLRKLLQGDLDEAQRIFGKNLIRKKRMQAQAALYIGAHRLGGYEEFLQPLAEQGLEVAKWALAVLEKK